MPSDSDALAAKLSAETAGIQATRYRALPAFDENESMVRNKCPDAAHNHMIQAAAGGVFEEVERAASELRPDVEDFWNVLEQHESKMCDSMRRSYSEPLLANSDRDKALLCRTDSEPCLTDHDKPCSWIEKEARVSGLLRVPSSRPVGLESSLSPMHVQHTQYTRTKRRYRGLVKLSAGDTSRSTPSLCSFDKQSFVLMGGENWDQKLVELPLGHVIVRVAKDKPSSFQLRVRSDSSFNCDTRIFLHVSSTEVRNRFLSALIDCNAAVRGWDASEHFRLPTSTRKGNLQAQVTWL
jgi:hypothetical protein